MASPSIYPHVCARPECGKHFMGIAKAKYCSRKCTANRPRVVPLDAEPRTCASEGCDQAFLSAHPGRKYCTNPCKQRDKLRRYGAKQCETCPTQKGVFRCRDGVLRCDVCRSYWKRVGTRRPERSIAAVEARRNGMKLCFRCGRAKPLPEFRSVDEYCKKCQRDYIDDWRAANPEKVEAYQTRYRSSPKGQSMLRAQSQRRRARKQDAFVEGFDPVEIFERDRWICQLCKKRVSKRAKWPNPKSVALDHTIPLALGGKHQRANVQCSHLGCNNSKRDRTLPQGEQLLLFG